MMVSVEDYNINYPMARGVQYVTINLMEKLLKWRVDNWATAEQKLHFINSSCKPEASSSLVIM